MSFFQELGCQVMGIDLSYALIKRGKKEAPASQLVIGDMQTLPLLPATFDMVLSLFTSFGYFEADEENQAVILSVYQTLKPGGYYWLDFLNAHCVIDNLVPETLSHVSTQLLAREKRKIEAGRIIKDIYFENEDQEVIEHYQESVRLFTRHDLEKMMEAARFQVLGCFGNYQGESWGENSPRTIIYGKKE